MNRPHHALRSVFRIQLPGTSTPIDDKLAVLDRLRTSHGRTAWHLMLSMEPQRLAMARPPRRPLVREIGNADPPAGDDLARWALELAGRLVEDAGTSGRRWAELIDRLLIMTRTEHDRIVSGLERLDPGTLQEEDRAKIWTSLGSVIARSSSLARMARPAMLGENPLQFERLFDRFAPDDPILRYRRFFAKPAWPRFEEGDEAGVSGYREALDRLQEARVEAVYALVGREGVLGVENLARTVDDPGALGHAAADESLEECQTGTLLSYLAHSERPLAQMATAYAARRASGSRPRMGSRQARLPGTESHGKTAGEPAAGPSPRPRSPGRSSEPAAMRCQPLIGATWNPGRIDDQDVLEAVGNLFDAGRPFVAAKLLAERLDSLAPHPLTRSPMFSRWPLPHPWRSTRRAVSSDTTPSSSSTLWRAMTSMRPALRAWSG